MRLRFEGMRPYVIAVDGQPTDSFEPLRASLPFMPGTRYDLLVDVPADDPTAGLHHRRAGGRGDPIVPDGRHAARREPARPPARHRSYRRERQPARHDPPAGRGARRARYRGRAEAGPDGRPDPASVNPDRPWTINGGVGDLKGKPLASVPKGRPLVIAISNRTAWPQVLHVHGHSFRLLHPLDDGWEPYWLDTVQIPEGRTLRIALRPDTPGRWLISSGVVERFEAGCGLCSR